MLVKALLIALSVATTCSLEHSSLSGVGADTTFGYRECKGGWQKFEGNCIKLLNQTYTYEQAQDVCAHQDPQRYSRLYTVKTVSAQAIYNNVIQLLQGTGMATWSGLTTTGTGSLKLVDPHGTTFDNPLLKGPPDHSQHCTTVDSLSGLNFGSCTLHLPVLCEANVGMDLCNAESTRQCQLSSGVHAECQQTESDAFCACKKGFTMNSNSLCVATTAIKFTSTQVTCNDKATGRMLMVFVPKGYANKRVTYSAASSECSKYGASLLYRSQLDSACITNFRFNLEQASDEATLVSSPMDVPSIWIQDSRGKCRVGNIQQTNERSCNHPTKFLCVKPITSVYWCEAADKLLVKISPIGLHEARSQCSSDNYWYLPVSSTLLSTSSFTAFPGLKSCVAAAVSTVQGEMTLEYPHQNVSMEDGKSCVTFDVQSGKQSSTCDFSSSHTFCVRDAPRTLVNKQTRMEYFHPMGNVRYAKASFSMADSLCKLAGGGIVKNIAKDNASIIGRAVQQLMFVPNVNSTLPDDSRYVWSTSSKSGCTKAAITGEPKSRSANCSDRTVPYVCSKPLSKRTNVTCPKYTYFHPDEDLLNTRHTYAIAVSACQKAGGTLPLASVLTNAAEAKCLQNAASANDGLQHPVSFAKPSRESIDLWLESSRGVMQIVFRSGDGKHYTAPRNSAQRYLCALVSATSDMGDDMGRNASGGSATGPITISPCPAGYEQLVGSANCTKVDECESRPCDLFSSCENIFGGYQCLCLSGYQKSSDSLTSPNCSNINECQAARCSGQNEDCLDTFGSYQCLCKPGFTRSGGKCVDIDECITPSLACPGRNSVCANTPGNFSCGCSKGYETNATGFCVDTDECQSSPCGRNAICSNMEGAFECRCKAGFTRSNLECVNVNECLHVVCNAKANCTDTYGSFSCQCSPGYTGDGFSCENINECNETNATMDASMVDQPCNASSLCVDLEGSFACPCSDNYTGDILCPAKKRTLDVVIEASRAPSAFSNPLVLTGIIVGGAVVLLLVVVVIRVARGKRPKTNAPGLPTPAHGANTINVQV